MNAAILAAILLAGNPVVEVNKTIENVRKNPNGEVLGYLTRGTEIEVLERQGQWLKVQMVGYMYAPSTTAAPVDAPALPVSIVASRLEYVPQNPRADVYLPQVRAFFQFRNDSDRPVTGVKFNAQFKDGFGDVLFENDFKSDARIPPHSTSDMTTYWYWEDNQFIQGEVFDKLWQAADNDSATIEVKVLQVAYGK